MTTAVDNGVVASREMCVHAFNVLVQRVRPGDSGDESEDDVQIANGLGGVFVTWSIRPKSASIARDSYSLRGCIGTLKPSTQIKGSITRYAAHAALHDPRFDPIHASELHRLKVTVSILSKFEKADGLYDWDIGTHGLILDIDSDSGHSKLSATYLPEVCAEQKWSKDYCLQSLAEKAGFSGTIKNYDSHLITLTRYQSTRAEMTYQEYLALTEK